MVTLAYQDEEYSGKPTDQKARIIRGIIRDPLTICGLGEIGVHGLNALNRVEQV